MVVDFILYLDGPLQCLVIDARLCTKKRKEKKLITTSETLEAMSNCTNHTLLGSDSLPYEFYVSIPTLFGSLLADVYGNWQQNRRIPNAVC